MVVVVVVGGVGRLQGTVGWGGRGGGVSACVRLGRDLWAWGGTGDCVLGVCSCHVLGRLHSRTLKVN